MTAPDFGALVAAVFAKEPHDAECEYEKGIYAERKGRRGETPWLVRVRCNCTHHVRAIAKVGRGIAAALRERARHACGSNVDGDGLVCPGCDWFSPVSGEWEASYHAHADAAAARAFEEASR